MQKYLYETQEFLKGVYEKSGFFCSHSFIAQVFYSQASEQYYFLKIAKKTKKASCGFAKRGYLNTIDFCTAKRWIAEGVQNGTVLGLC